MDVVVDTDVLSTFCKVDKLELLQKLFHKSTIIIAPSVYREIREAERLGIVAGLAGIGVGCAAFASSASQNQFFGPQMMGSFNRIHK